MKTKVLLILLCVLLIGCHRLDSGIVIHKEFEPEHSQTYIAYIYTGKTNIPVFQTRTIPDRWYIIIEGVIDAKKRKETIYVSKDEYESINIGDFIRIKRRGGKNG